MPPPLFLHCSRIKRSRPRTEAFFSLCSIISFNLENATRFLQFLEVLSPYSPTHFFLNLFLFEYVGTLESVALEVASMEKVACVESWPGWGRRGEGIGLRITRFITKIVFESIVISTPINPDFFSPAFPDFPLGKFLASHHPRYIRNDGKWWKIGDRYMDEAGDAR